MSGFQPDKASLGHAESGINQQLTKSGYDRLLENLKVPALAMVFISVVATITFKAIDLKTTFDPPYLILVLSSLFIGIPSFFISFIAVRGFERTGNWALVWMSIGALMYGLGILLGSLLVTVANANAAVTTSNIIFLFAATMHFAGAFFILNGVQTRSSGRAATLQQVYIAGLAFITFILVLTLRDLLPPFFVPGTGGTIFRALVGATAAFLLLLSGVMVFRQFMKSRLMLLYWYSLSLVLLSIGLANGLLIQSLGTPLNWVGRGTQVLGGIYLMMAALVTLREAKTKQITSAEAITDAFKDIESKLKESEERFFKAFHSSPVGLAIARLDDGYITDVNNSFLNLTEYGRDELIGHLSPEFNFLDNAGEINTIFFEKGRVFDFETTLRTKTDKRPKVLVSVEKINLNGVDHCLNTLIDITERKKAGDELRLKQKALDSSVSAIGIADMEGKLTYVNDALAKIWGTDRKEDLLGRSILEFAPWRDNALKVMEGLKTQGYWAGELIANRKDGSTSDILLSASMVLSEDGKPVAMMGSFVDITERKKAEEAIKRANVELEERVRQRTIEVSSERRRLFNVLETLPAYVVLLDKDYRVPFANRFFRERFGESHGKRCFEYLFNKIEVCENCESYVPMKTGVPYHWEWLGPDGRNYDINDYPFKDTDGSLMIMEMGIDITERKKAEAALKELNETLEHRVSERTAEVKESEARFRAITETSPVALSVRLLEGTPLYMNAAYEKLFGYTAKELTGLDASELYADSQDRLKWTGIFREKGLLKDFEVKLKRKDGTSFWALISATPIIFSGTQAVMGTIVDITERKKTERIKDEFIGMVSHELKTPLQIVMAALHVANAKGISEEESKDLLKEAVNGTNTLAGIIENLLELSRSQANRLVLDRELTDLRELAKDVVQKLSGKSSIHRLIVDLPEGLPVVVVDPVRVERILFNLVENAIKYSPKGGEVRMFVKRKDNDLAVCVSDQGPGISPENQKKLFQSFEQLDISRRQAMQGVGLGLKVCRTLVEAHGGRIWVESEPGKGASFCFTLPLTKQG